MSDKRLVDSLVFHIGAKRYRYVPQRADPRDTPYLLSLLIAALATRTLGEFDLAAYVQEHDLWRCFEEIE
jgi:hypothetical protein